MKFLLTHISHLGKLREFNRDGSEPGNLSEPEDDNVDDDEGVRRPFQAKKLKKTKEPIVMNIRVSKSFYFPQQQFPNPISVRSQNAVAIPPKTIEHKAELLAQLSRHHNRRNESDWKAIDKKQTTQAKIVPKGKTILI